MQADSCQTDTSYIRDRLEQAVAINSVLENAVNPTSAVQIIERYNQEDAFILSQILSPSEAGDEASDEDAISIQCRSIRIGSYRVQAISPQSLSVVVSAKEIRFTVACIDGRKTVNISLKKEDIPLILGHFGKVLPVLFIYATPACASSIRKQLNMTDMEKPYYDPCHPDQCRKRITMLPVKLDEQQKLFLKKVFPGRLLSEIKQAESNELLIQTVPVNNPVFYHHLNSLTEEPERFRLGHAVNPLIQGVEGSSTDNAVPSNRTLSLLEAGDDEVADFTISFQCRSIQIGSYKVQAYNPRELSVVATAEEIRFTVASIGGRKMVKILLQKEDISLHIYPYLPYSCNI